VRAAVKCPDLSRGARLTAHSAVSTSLALRSDRTLRELVDTAAQTGSGIGGKSALLEVAGTPVFVKRVPLTDPERRPENARSTANIFALPAFCQYGIGGPGFGAWRELAVHIMTTNWVLDFYRKLQQESRQTPYPLEEILRVSGMDSVSEGTIRPASLSA
jgi:hypothetical protein